MGLLYRFSGNSDVERLQGSGTGGSNSGIGLLCAISHEDHYPLLRSAEVPSRPACIFLTNQIAGHSYYSGCTMPDPSRTQRWKHAGQRMSLEGNTVPVSEVGLCVTHWASGSSFAENDIRLTFSREGVGGWGWGAPDASFSGNRLGNRFTVRLWQGTSRRQRK